MRAAASSGWRVGASAEATALIFYSAQLNDIRMISKRLVDGEKDLLKELTEAAAKDKVFTL